jgi:membrane protein implicated in regulation of membrane protease activity
MSAWLTWVVVAIALAVGEIFTPGLFFLGPVAVAAVIAGLVSLAGVGAPVQLLVFIAGSIGSVAVLRPLARRHIRLPPELRTGTDALVGVTAIVLRQVDRDGGLVRIGGEEWSARAYLEDQVIEAGKRVEVVKIEGATALVYE